MLVPLAVAGQHVVANICYEGFTLTQAPTSNDLDVANDCTSAKKSNSQAVAGGNNKHVEVLKQDNVHHQPIYKKNVLNGQGKARASMKRGCRLAGAAAGAGRAMWRRN